MIPISFGQLKKINFLSVSDNNLEGTVTEAHFANLSMLKSFDISYNNLGLYLLPDWIPPFQLRKIRLSSCKISGEFPRWLQTQSELKMLVLSNTTITGPLPSWLVKMPIIPHLDLSDNRLSGPLTNLPAGHPFSGEFQDEYRGSLLLQKNLFNGTIPESLCRRTALEVLDLSQNRLAGEIPKCLGNLKKLRAMLFSSNELSGVIPGSIGHNSLLSWLNLNNNSFTGELPQELGNLHDLWILNLGNNDFSGKIPEWIAELTQLMALSLHNNNFTERIPSSLCKIPCLQIFVVAQNSLIGSIPSCLGTLQGMIESQNCRHHIYSEEGLIQDGKGIKTEISKSIPYIIDLSSNELVGQIPGELTALSQLTGLYLSQNHLSGSIPDNIGNLEYLEFLDFSENELTGMIPLSMTDMHFLIYLNLSHNNLSGRIPSSTQLQSFNSSTYADNRDLCGPPLSTECPRTTKNYDQKADERKQKVVWLFQWDIMSGFATGFCGVIGVLLINKAWRHEFYRFADVTMDKIYVAVAIKVNKIKRRREAA